MSSGAGGRCGESGNPARGPAGGTQLTPPMHHKVQNSSHKLSGGTHIYAARRGCPVQWGQINADLRDRWPVAECGAEGLQEPWCLARAPDHPQDAHTCLACKP